MGGACCLHDRGVQKLTLNMLCLFLTSPGEGRPQHYITNAAINVTKITTGVLPHEKQPIYGTRALDFVYDVNPEDFDLADFFGEEAPVRITTMASPEMIQHKLIKNIWERRTIHY